MEFINNSSNKEIHQRNDQENLITINKLTHIYETEDKEPFYALKGVSLDIYKGEFLAVIGTNGSGKSTLARHLDGILLPSEGDVVINGLSTSNSENTWQIRQTVGMVFQNPDNQLVASIVEDDVAFGPENLGVPREEIIKRVTQALQRIDMESYKHHATGMLSGGQKQRVAIAGVLAMHPQCIVLDEPTAMLDPSGRKEVMDTIQYLNKNLGITIVLITHFMEEAVMADRVVVMNRGQIVKQGSARDVFSDVKGLKNTGLDVPVPTEISYYLAEKGVSISNNCMTNEELGDELCQFRLKK